MSPCLEAKERAAATWQVVGVLMEWMVLELFELIMKHECECVWYMVQIFWVPFNQITDFVYLFCSFVIRYYCVLFCWSGNKLRFHRVKSPRWSSCQAAAHWTNLDPTWNWSLHSSCDTWTFDIWGTIGYCIITRTSTHTQIVLSSGINDLIGSDYLLKAHQTIIPECPLWFRFYSTGWGIGKG